MKTSKITVFFSGSRWLVPVLSFLVAIVLIVWFMPREEKFNYQFETGKPWKYGLLTAPYDFPIYKNAEAVARERDSLMAYYRPYVAVDDALVGRMLSRLRADYATRLKDRLPGGWRPHVERLLAAIYQAGVMDSEVYDRLRRENVQEVMFMRNNTATPVSLASVYTLKSAYHLLLHQDTVNYPLSRLQQCDLNLYLEPNLTYDSLKSADARSDLMLSVSSASGMVQTGQKIIDRGEIVSPQTYVILESLRQASLSRESDRTSHVLIWVGQVLFAVMVLVCFFLYLYIYRRDYFEQRNALLLMIFFIVCYTLATYLLVRLNLVNVYIVPYAMIPIVVHVLLDSRTAFVTHVTTVLLCSISLHFVYEFVLFQLIAGMVAAYSLRELTQRSQLYRVAILVMLSYSLTNVSLELMHRNEISAINLNLYFCFLVNGIFLLFSYPLLFAMEKGFGFTSNVTLIELSNTSNKLLRRLSEEAPGTFQHTVQVSNLAAAAAARIGANVQLVRTGALYHDIGKLSNPIFFTENQSGLNPHAQLSYEQGAQVVIGHVRDGLKIADQYGLPRVIKDFIATHHGKGVAKYFLISWKNEHPGQEPDLERFSYPGPDPFTRETALLMMADGVEAASRSLPEYTDEAISALVDRIVDSQVAAGFFNNCPITFRDIASVKAVFRERLKSVYHPRVSYPEEKKVPSQAVPSAEGQGAAASSGAGADGTPSGPRQGGGAAGSPS